MTTINLKTKKINHNCQKIELYESLTTKELKRKHSFRLVGGAEKGSWDGEDMWQGGNWSVWADEAAAGSLGRPTFMGG